MNAYKPRKPKFQNSSGKMPSDYKNAKNAFELSRCGKAFKKLDEQEQIKLEEMAIDLVPMMRSGFGVRQAAELIIVLGLFMASNGVEGCH